MEYLLQEIFWYLIIAFALGAAIGWFVSQQGSKSKIAALEAQLSGGQTGTPIESIEGIGQGFGKRLKADGISTTEALLELCASDAGIEKVCKCVDLDENTIRNWATMADLMRIKGLGGQWAELMWRAGVTSVQDLAQREIEPLRARMREVNEEEHRVAELPGEKRVTKFLEDAARMDAVFIAKLKQ
jgi:predicted flap endonuclease-1-like 5' DNA nuclease